MNERIPLKIRTENIYPPIPLRQFDWQATTDNYEPGCPIGFGPTEQEAVADLLEQIEDSLDRPVITNPA